MEEVKKEEKSPTMRQIIIETDGTNVVLKKAEVASLIELNGIMSMIIKFVNAPKAQTPTSPNTPEPEIGHLFEKVPEEKTPEIEETK